MIRHLRATLRLTAVLLVGCVYYPVLRLSSLGSVARPKRAAQRRARIFRSWSALLLRILNARFKVSGRVPTAPFYLVCNHLSYLDILVLASRLEAVFVARGDVVDWPLLGGVIRRMDTIFIDRSMRRDVARVVEETRLALERGDGVVLFPEGTSTGGDDLLPFRPSLLQTPVQLGIPVEYAALSYATPEGCRPAREAVCWWGKMEFPPHLWGLLGLPRIEVGLAFGDAPVLRPDRKALATALHEAVRSSLPAVVGSTPNPAPNRTRNPS